MQGLADVVLDFAQAMKGADSRRPQAANVRSKELFQPGIGPHSESKTVELVAAEMELLRPEAYSGRISTGVGYPDIPRQKCDLCLGTSPGWEWAIEVKMLRMLGDNGKLNGNILMHILSPYPEHRSALTDCQKLLASGIAEQKAIIIYGYDHEDWPVLLAIDAFERLASAKARLGARHTATFDHLTGCGRM